MFWCLGPWRRLVHHSAFLPDLLLNDLFETTEALNENQTAKSDGNPTEKVCSAEAPLPTEAENWPPGFYRVCAGW